MRTMHRCLKSTQEGWRKAYVDAIPNDFMEREITDDRWIPFFQETFSTGVNHGLLVYDGDQTRLLCLLWTSQNRGWSTVGHCMQIPIQRVCRLGGDYFLLYSARTDWEGIWLSVDGGSVAPIETGWVYKMLSVCFAGK